MTQVRGFWRTSTTVNVRKINEDGPIMVYEDSVVKGDRRHALLSALVPHFLPRHDHSTLPIQDLCGRFVHVSITNLPWFYRVPLRVYLFTMEFFPLVLRRARFSALPQDQQIRFVQKVYPRFPGWGALSRLVQTLCLFAYYDYASVSEGDRVAAPE